MKSLLQGLTVSFFTFLILFVFLETAAEIYLVKFSRDEVFRKYASLSQLKKRLYFHHMPHRYLGHVPTPNYREGLNRHNALGFRGDEVAVPKPEGEFRIICLGGSTTYSGSVEDYRKAYPALLENELKRLGHSNIKVVNAGVNSYASWETLINFEFRVLDLEPDLILTYDNINDVGPRLVWPPQSYRGDNSGYLTSANQRFMPSIFEYSTLCRIFMIKLNLVQPHNTLHSAADFASTSYAAEFVKQKGIGTYPQGIFKNVSAMEMLNTNKPVYFRRNIEDLVAIAQSRGIKVVLSTFAYSTLFTDQPEVASDEYRRALDEHNNVLREIAAQKHAGLCDLAKEFPQDKAYYTDGRHMTQKGDALRASLYADFLDKSGLLKS
jgi:hypothetical protein